MQNNAYNRCRLQCWDVNWNNDDAFVSYAIAGHLPCEGVNWNDVGSFGDVMFTVAPTHGGVNWNDVVVVPLTSQDKSSHMGRFYLGFIQRKKALSGYLLMYNFQQEIIAENTHFDKFVLLIA